MLLFEIQIASANIVKKSSHCQRLFEIYYPNLSQFLFSTASKCRIIYSLGDDILKCLPKLFIMESGIRSRLNFSAKKIFIVEAEQEAPQLAIMTPRYS